MKEKIRQERTAGDAVQPERAEEEPFWTIGRTAKSFGIARSTLLYYDSIGLLSPAQRSRAKYRRYTPEDRRRLASICMYRQIGLSMSAIKEILQAPPNTIRDILERRLLELAGEIAGLRAQQQVIIRMLGEASLQKRIPFMDKEGWIAVMRAAGLSENDMDKWHREFEAFSPQLHQEFLEGLGIPTLEIVKIRERSRQLYCKK